MMVDATVIVILLVVTVVAIQGKLANDNDTKHEAYARFDMWLVV